MGAILGGRVQTYLGPHRQKGPLMQTEYHHYSFTPHAGALDLLLVRHGESEPAIASRWWTAMATRRCMPMAPPLSDHRGRAVAR